MQWWLILGVSMPDLRNVERTERHSVLLDVSEKAWLQESGLWLSGMSGRFAPDLARDHHISWRLRMNKRERERVPSSSGHWTSKLQLAWSWDSGFGSVVPEFSNHWWGLRMMSLASLALALEHFPWEHAPLTFQRACSGTSQPPWAHQPIVLMK